MHIFVVSQIFAPTPFRINDIVQSLTAAGHRVTVLTGLPDYGLKTIPAEYRFWRRRREQLLGATVIRVPTTARRSGVFWRALNYASFAVNGWLYANFCRVKDIDAILCYETSPVFQAVPARRLRKRSGRPFVLYCLDLWPASLKAWRVPERHPVYRWAGQASRKLYRSADRVPVSSPTFGAYLTSVCGVEPDRIDFLPQHAEDQFAAVAGAPHPNGCCDFVYAGNIGSVQAVDQLIAAVSLMRTRRRFHVHIIGSGSELDRVQAQAEDLGLSDRVTFYGQQPLEAMPAYYQLADVFLLTLQADGEITDTIPGKLQGYMSAGRPVVAAARGAVPVVLAAADCGWTVDPGDPAALAAAMDFAAEHEAEGRLKGERGHAYYQAHFTRSRVMERLLRLLQNQPLNDSER